MRSRTSFKIASSTSLGREARGVEIFGVGRLGQRGFGAGAVAVVALGDFLGDLCDGGSGFGGAAYGADFGCGVQIDFHLRVGEHDGADVAAFHHDGLGGTDAALLFAHGAADAGGHGNFRRGFADARLADGGGDVFAV